MNKFKDKILKSIEANSANLLTKFPLKNEYLKLFKNMSPISTKVADFTNSPAEFFDNFDYEIYAENNFTNSKEFINSKINLSDFEQKIPENTNLIVTVNGFFSKENSKIHSKNLIVASLAEKMKENFLQIEQHFSEYFDLYENQITALNSVLAKDGIYLEIPENSVINEPICILNVITEQDKNYFFNSKSLLIFQKNSNAKIIETDFYLSEKKSLTVNLFFAKLAENTNVEFYKLNANLANKNQNYTNLSKFSKNNFTLEANSALKYLFFSSDIFFERNRNHFVLNGKNSEANMLSFSLLKNTRTVDSKSLAAHFATQTKFNQTVKVIAYDNSNFAFDGKILVEKDAQKANSSQNSRAILMSDNAKANIQPQLEIYADDVNCSHGSAVGGLDEDLIFYLNARGISDEQAKQLLLAGFAGEIINEIPFENIRNSLLNGLF